jgi:hypothetical protein
LAHVRAVRPSACAIMCAVAIVVRRTRTPQPVDPNRIPWPPGRSDVLGLIAIGVIADALANEAWALAGFALLVCVFAAAFPRMEREYEVGGGPPRLKGYLAPLQGHVVSQPPPPTPPEEPARQGDPPPTQ